jgi:hypothetical protein
MRSTDMTSIQGFDHIALAVPDLDGFVNQMIGMGMAVVSRQEKFALLADPASGFKLELSVSSGEAQFRHLGFRAADVDTAYEQLVSAGMATVEKPHRRDFAKMRTAFLKEKNGVEVQLVKYD